MRILVTGATGFIGRQLVQRLLANGVETFGLALPQDTDRLRLKLDVEPGLTLFPADLRNVSETAEAVARIQPDRIVHLAAAGVTDPAIDSALALEHNVGGTLNLIHAAFQNRAAVSPPRQLIVIRTPGEAHPANAYTASKAAAWSFCQMYARRYSWPIMGAMIFQAYGPDQAAYTFVQAALRAAEAGEDFAMTSGEQVRDWIYRDDVVAGLMAALSHELPPGSSVDLGTGIRTSLLEVAELSYQIAGNGGAPTPGALPDRAGEAIGVAADAERTKELLNWAPEVPLGSGLRLVLESLRD